MEVGTQQRTHTVKLDGKAPACEHARIFGDPDPMNGLFQTKLMPQHPGDETLAGALRRNQFTDAR